MDVQSDLGIHCPVMIKGGILSCRDSSLSVSLDSVHELDAGRHGDPGWPGWMIGLIWVFIVLA